MKNNNIEKHEIFTSTLDFLSDISIEFKGKRAKYSDADLVYATNVFMEVYSNKVFDYQKDNLPKDCFLNIGNSFREMVIKDTGIDLHEAVKKMFNK